VVLAVVLPVCGQHAWHAGRAPGSGSQIRIGGTPTTQVLHPIGIRPYRGGCSRGIPQGTREVSTMDQKRQERWHRAMAEFRPRMPRHRSRGPHWVLPPPPTRFRCVGRVLSERVRGGGDAARAVTPTDLPPIKAAIQPGHARLAIMDPLMAGRVGTTNSNRDQDMRAMLAPLARLAARMGVAIVVLRHLSKGGGANAIDRGGGARSSAWRGRGIGGVRGASADSDSSA